MKTILSPEQVETYQNTGFISPLSALSQPEVQMLREAVDDHLSGRGGSELYELTDPISIKNAAQEGKPPAFYYVPTDKTAKVHTFPFLMNVWRHDDRFARIARSERLAQIARELLGVHDVLLFEDNIVVKAPNSKYLPWHQDYSYWPLGEPRALTIWIPLDDVGPDNGAMEVAPGTHRLGERLPVAFGDGSSFMEQERPQIPPVPSDPKKLGYETQTYELKAGECGIHDAMIWHGSTPNHSDKPRRVYILRYVGAGTLWLGENRMAYDEIACAPGGRLTSNDFPVPSEVKAKSG